MANNRMYLVNQNTGIKIYLAKYYPSSGWCLKDNIQNELENGFHKSDIRYAAMYGDNWQIEYEIESDGEKERDDDPIPLT